VNSARVAGGFAPAPAQSILPDPQSPVWQVNLPVGVSAEQRVRPQNRPPQPDGVFMTLDSPFWRENPVVLSCETPAFERIPGHTVYSQLFIIVNVAASPAGQNSLTIN